MSALGRMIARELVRRTAPSYEAQFIIWPDDDAQVEAEIAAAKAAGWIGPKTEILIVSWKPCPDTAGAPL